MANDSIRLHPENPRYFLFRGQPTVLITAGEHYGSVINLDFDFVHMRPDRSVVGPITAAKVQALCAPGQSYAIYINTKDGPRQHELSLELPAGNYDAAWIDPLTGAEVATTSFAHAGETKRLAFPLFTQDIALAIRATPRG
jgi:hypothetical protein